MVKAKPMPRPKKTQTATTECKAKELYRRREAGDPYVGTFEGKPHEVAKLIDEHIRREFAQLDLIRK